VLRHGAPMSSLFEIARRLEKFNRRATVFAIIDADIRRTTLLPAYFTDIIGIMLRRLSNVFHKDEDEVTHDKGRVKTVRLTVQGEREALTEEEGNSSCSNLPNLIV